MPNSSTVIGIGSTPNVANLSCTAGTASYGGGRYLLDTAKGADLGSTERADGTWLTIDLNFLYHPSCHYNDAWDCPLAPDGNTTRVPITAGERLDHNPL